MTSEPDIDSKIKNLGEALVASYTTLRAGESIDLKGLDVEVGKVCELIISLDKEAGRRYLPQLHSLVETLDTLGVDLHDAFEASKQAR